MREILKEFRLRTENHASSKSNWGIGLHIHYCIYTILDTHKYIHTYIAIEVYFYTYQTNYLLSKDDYYFLYPNEQNKYKTKLNGSFQHGGVSMQEMMVPIRIMDPK